MKKSVKSKLNIGAVVVMIIVIVLLLPVIIVASTLIIKSVINPDYPPDIFGYAPLTVVSGSMSGDNEDSFNKGDLIFIKVLNEDEKNNLQAGDVICYIAEGDYITHRIVLISKSDDGKLQSLITKGDANYGYDNEIYAENVFGVYTGKIAGVGYFAEFLQSTAGLIVFVVVPVGLFVLFEVYRFIKGGKKKDEQKQIEDYDKDEEIARLKKMLEEQQKSDNGGKS